MRPAPIAALLASVLLAIHASAQVPLGGGVDTDPAVRNLFNSQAFEPGGAFFPQGLSDRGNVVPATRALDLSIIPGPLIRVSPSIAVQSGTVNGQARYTIDLAADHPAEVHSPFASTARRSSTASFVDNTRQIQARLSVFGVLDHPADGYDPPEALGFPTPNALGAIDNFEIDFSGQVDARFFLTSSQTINFDPRFPGGVPGGSQSGGTGGGTGSFAGGTNSGGTLISDGFDGPNGSGGLRNLGGVGGTPTGVGGIGGPLVFPTPNKPSIDLGNDAILPPTANITPTSGGPTGSRTTQPTVYLDSDALAGGLGGGTGGMTFPSGTGAAGGITQVSFKDENGGPSTEIPTLSGGTRQLRPSGESQPDGSPETAPNPEDQGPSERELDRLLTTNPPPEMPYWLLPPYITADSPPEALARRRAALEALAQRPNDGSYNGPPIPPEIPAEFIFPEDRRKQLDIEENRARWNEIARQQREEQQRILAERQAALDRATVWRTDRDGVRRKYILINGELWPADLLARWEDLKYGVGSFKDRKDAEADSRRPRRPEETDGIREPWQTLEDYQAELASIQQSLIDRLRNSQPSERLALMQQYASITEKLEALPGWDTPVGWEPEIPINPPLADESDVGRPGDQPLSPPELLDRIADAEQRLKLLRAHLEEVLENIDREGASTPKGIAWGDVRETIEHAIQLTQGQIDRDRASLIGSVDPKLDPRSQAILDDELPSLKQYEYEVIRPFMDAEQRKWYEERGMTPPNCFANAFGWGEGVIPSDLLDLTLHGLLPFDSPLADPYYKLDKRAIEELGYSRKEKFRPGRKYPADTILVYEQPIDQVVTNTNIPLPEGRVWKEVPNHAAKLGESGEWLSVTGPGGAHLLHEDPNAVGDLGKPAWVYIPPQN